MTVHEVKIWLRQYRKIQREIKDIELRITQLRLKFGMPSAINYSDMPKGGGNGADLADYMAALEEYEQILKARRMACIELLKQYSKAIEHLDYDEAHVIRRRYLDGARWVQIAMEIPCSERTVYYIHGHALQRLQSIAETM